MDRLALAGWERIVAVHVLERGRARQGAAPTNGSEPDDEKVWTAALNQTELEKLTDGLARLSDHLRETE